MAPTMLLQAHVQKNETVLVNTDNLALGLLPRWSFTVPDVREIDRILIEEQGIPGIVLMRRAAAASVQILLEQWPEAQNIRVYCGSGNNAADGYIVAGMLAAQGLRVEVIKIGDTAKLTADGQRALEYCEQSPARMVVTPAADFEPDAIVDALLGTGFRGELRPAYQSAIESINAAGVPVLSLDVPSGVAMDPAEVDLAVSASVTVTFIALKRGLLTGAAVDYVGRLYLAPLADIEPIMDRFTGIELLELNELLRQLPARAKHSHKFSNGHVLVVGGGRGMGGAPLMTAIAAMRAGAGLVSLATHPEHAGHLVGLHPEIMIRGVASPEQLAPLLEKADLIAVGPGLGSEPWAKAIFQAVLNAQKPLVVDADGLNLLSEMDLKRADWVLTPHPGEAKRLLGGELPVDRFAAAEALQTRYDGTVVLKGAGTLVCASDGAKLCPYGNPGMSTAGMGDVLCGVIAGVLAQTRDTRLSAQLGVVLHSAAADQVVAEEGTRGLLATDLVPIVRRMINQI